MRAECDEGSRVRGLVTLTWGWCTIVPGLQERFPTTESLLSNRFQVHCYSCITCLWCQEVLLEGLVRVGFPWGAGWPRAQGLERDLWSLASSCPSPIIFPYPSCPAFYLSFLWKWLWAKVNQSCLLSGTLITDYPTIASLISNLGGLGPWILFFSGLSDIKSDSQPT